MKRLIVVVGVDSRQGSGVIEALLEYSTEWHIRGTTEDVTSFHSQEFALRGVEMVQCNINDREECCRALANAYGVFAITNYWISIDGDEYKQAVNLVEAARANNVQHFITNGLPDTMTFDRTQYDLPLYAISRSYIQNYIQTLPSNSTFPYITYIHGGFYYQNLTTFFVPDSINLEFRYPILSHARIPMYDVRDTGKIIQECFRHPDKWGDGQIVTIVAEQLTMEEICTTIRQVTGKNVHFVPLRYEDALVKLHRETLNNFRWYNDIGSIDEHQAEKTRDIWPNMRTLAGWIRETQWLME